MQISLFEIQIPLFEMQISLFNSYSVYIYFTTNNNSLISLGASNAC